FEPASLIVPEVTLRREPHGGQLAVRLTLAALAFWGDTAQGPLERLQARLAQLRTDPLPLLDPAPAGRFQVASTMPPEHYEAAVARAVELIGRGRLEKIVL